MSETQTKTTLDQLKLHTTVVADTSDFELIEKYRPQDATTNPSLILKSSQKEEYKDLIDEAILFGKSQISKNTLDLIAIKLFVNFGLEILKKIPGRVSIEVDAKYSFDTEKSVEIARLIISLFEKNGIDRERILIKLATTYEGIKACEILEKENIHCNMTLLFSLAQAIGAADAKATLISPFVGRILDWYKTNHKKEYLPQEDPGVVSVTNIFNYFKKFDIKTQIMGASFRNANEIIELAGCDLLTISPNLLEELQTDDRDIQKKLNSELSKDMEIDEILFNEKTFRYMLNQDAMATEKLSEGIRKFEVDLNKIKNLIGDMLK
ncbi:MAG: Transaldolase [Candidatus Anoxychlamydiales bacterium]|nr:Transaldolase [Candidatus Anoxychlamydiales bacterium]